jgi:C1A family cysteine protease
MEITKYPQQYGLGYIPDVPDSRDYSYSPDTVLLGKLPAEVKLHEFPVYDQGRIGSCTANALAGAIEYLREANQKRPRFTPSRLFIYYNIRIIENSVDYDAGARIRDGIKTLHKKGVCTERVWAYDDTPPAAHNEAFPADAPAVKKPSSCCYEEAQNYLISC